MLLNRSGKTQRDLLRGRTLINLFFEDSTRTRTSFELAGKRLGADVINMSRLHLLGQQGRDADRHRRDAERDALRPAGGAPRPVRARRTCWPRSSMPRSSTPATARMSIPTQALLDALTIKRRKGRIAGLIVAICGDIAHSRVARSNIHLLTTMGCQVRVVGPPTLIPAEVADLGVTVFHDMAAGLAGADVVMMLRLQRERMSRGQVPSAREYFRFYGLDTDKLALCQARRHRHASRADEPRRRDRQRGRRRSGAQRDQGTGRDGGRRPHGGAGHAVTGPSAGMNPDTLFSGVRILGAGVDVTRRPAGARWPDRWISARRLGRPDGATVVEAEDAILCPGLVDMRAASGRAGLRISRDHRLGRGCRGGRRDHHAGGTARHPAGDRRPGAWCSCCGPRARRPAA